MKLSRLIVLLLISSSSLYADALLNSWLTSNSGQYARVYESIADQNAQNAVATWDQGSGSQLTPVYADINAISYSDNWVYILHSGLASHNMGPWYFDDDDSILFANFPANQNRLYKISRNPVEETGTRETTAAGINGIYVNGVALFDVTDTFSYDTSTGFDAVTADQNDPAGDGSVDSSDVIGDFVWNRNAVVNEIVTLDPAFAHQAGSNYHYHSSPSGLRYQLGDSVDYDVVTNTYTENFNNQHSPIIGWAADGFPLYGPYGYSDPTDANSTVRRMVSGFQKRDGTNGSTNLSTTGRVSIPTWSLTYQTATTTTLNTENYGPDVDEQINWDIYGEEFEHAELGRYLEDYAYKGNLTGLDFYEGVAIDGAYTEGSDFDLNLYNGRFCVTPEFPDGIFAYFITIESDGSPVFPYVLGREFFGEVTAESVTTVDDSETITEHFNFETVTENLNEITTNEDSITITWNALEGGVYTVQSSLTLEDDFLDETTTAIPDITSLNFEDVNILSTEDKKFYRIERTGISDFEAVDPSNTDTGGGGGPGGGGPGGGGGRPDGP